MLLITHSKDELPKAGRPGPPGGPWGPALSLPLINFSCSLPLPSHQRSSQGLCVIQWAVSEMARCRRAGWVEDTLLHLSHSPTFCLFLKSSASILACNSFTVLFLDFSPSMWLHQSPFPLCSFCPLLLFSQILLPYFSPSLFLQDTVHIFSFLSKHSIFSSSLSHLSPHLFFIGLLGFSYLPHPQIEISRDMDRGVCCQFSALSFTWLEQNHSSKHAI